MEQMLSAHASCARSYGTTNLVYHFIFHESKLFERVRGAARQREREKKHGKG